MSKGIHDNFIDYIENGATQREEKRIISFLNGVEMLNIIRYFNKHIILKEIPILIEMGHIKADSKKKGLQWDDYLIYGYIRGKQAERAKHKKKRS